MINVEGYKAITGELSKRNVTLVAVSKIKPNEDIQALYNLGQRDFGENYVQELTDKAAALPTDIRWHFIGHLQSNKVKYIAPFVYLIHGIDSFKLLQEINKQAAKNNRIIDCLLQVHVAQEETKFGFSIGELPDTDALSELKNVRVVGLMGMASNTDDEAKLHAEFKQLKQALDAMAITNNQMTVLSMGMSGDYKIAIEEGSTMVRIGSLLFGARKA